MRNFLISFGGTIAVMNTVLYFALRESGKHHGLIQLSLIPLGCLMVVAGIFGPKLRANKEERG